MSGVQGAEERLDFGASTLPNDEPVGAHPHRRESEFGQAHAAGAFNVRLSRLERNGMRVVNRNLSDIFNGDNPLASIDFRQERAKHGRLATARPTGHEDVPSLDDGLAQEIQLDGLEGSYFDELFEGERGGTKHAK